MQPRYAALVLQPSSPQRHPNEHLALHPILAAKVLETEEHGAQSASSGHSRSPRAPSRSSATVHGGGIKPNHELLAGVTTLRQKGRRRPLSVECTSDRRISSRLSTLSGSSTHTLLAEKHPAAPSSNIVLVAVSCSTRASPRCRELNTRSVSTRRWNRNADAHPMLHGAALSSPQFHTPPRTLLQRRPLSVGMGVTVPTKLGKAKSTYSQLSLRGAVPTGLSVRHANHIPLVP